ncbi:MAG: hypothetical protein JRJ31_23090, partial [Deltaproteobacteria bacterium]|nr:hypothetical protein [Deltaproteobacteria bacterium]
LEKATQAFKGLSEVSERIQNSAETLQGWFDEALGSFQSAASQHSAMTKAYFTKMAQWSEVFLAKLSETAKPLEGDGPVYAALIQLNETLKKVEQDSSGGRAGGDMEQVLLDLGGTINGLKAFLQKISEGNGRLDEVLQELKNIHQSTHSLAQAVDDLKVELRTPEEKKGIFPWRKNK